MSNKQPHPDLRRAPWRFGPLSVPTQLRSRGRQSAPPSHGEVAPTHVGGYEQGFKLGTRVWNGKLRFPTDLVAADVRRLSLPRSPRRACSRRLLQGEGFKRECLWRILALCAATTLCLTGCTPVRVQHQRLVSQPNMTFSESPVWNYYSRQLPQAETGLAFSGGGQGAGCSSCK